MPNDSGFVVSASTVTKEDSQTQSIAAAKTGVHRKMLMKQDRKPPQGITSVTL
ncbi:hypothetical protein [Geomonas ferrireducens]|uniref:hypothetical protein n=1 Tax=Geomonas ferrireducens TaxID=2570227 RepID=UPI0013A5D432|nr:hypothetical protein [Geomonas ferrireducens]